MLTYLFESVVEVQEFGVVEIVHDRNFVLDHVPKNVMEKKISGCH